MKIIHSNGKPKFITLLEEALFVMRNSLMFGDAYRIEIVKKDIEEFLKK